MNIEPELACSIWHHGNTGYNQKRVAAWMYAVWMTTHPPFRYLRRAIIKTLVSNRIIT